MRVAAIIILAVALCAFESGCFLARRAGGTGGQSAPSPSGSGMSGPEAQRTLARAREKLYAAPAADCAAAVRLADTVILNCKVRRYVWEGHLVKASAFLAAGNTAIAEQAARVGVTTIIASDSGALSDGARTALKMLLPLYVESAAASGRHEEVIGLLGSWRAAIAARYAALKEPDAAGREAIEAEFDLLAQMLDQQMASRKPEARVQELVQQYTELFNARNSIGMAALFEPGSDPAKRMAEHGVAGLVGEPVEGLYLGSAVRVTIVPAADGDKDFVAQATCDLVVLSPAGRARVVRGVRFALAKAEAGDWRIRGIAGHP